MGAMREVELEEGWAETPTDRPAKRPRLPRKAVVGAVALAVVTVVGFQLVVTSREQAADVHLVGLVDTLADQPRALWEVADPGPRAWAGTLGDDALARLVVTDDGSQRLLVTDARTGEAVWSRTLAGRSSRVADSLAQGGTLHAVSTCQTPADDPGSPLVVCLVSDGYSMVLHTADGVETSTVSATSTIIKVLDVADGSVVGTWRATGSALLVPDADDVVVADSSSPSLDVTDHATTTGRPLWSVHLPVVGMSTGENASLVLAGRHIAARTFGSMGVLDRDGHVLRKDLGAQSSDVDLVVRGTQVQLAYSSGPLATTTLVSADRSGDVTVKGTPLRIGVDDGSLSATVLTTGEGLRAWDARTGALRWASHTVNASFAGAVVLDGIAYVPTTSGVVAIDGRGTTRWQNGSSPPDLMVTDGDRLIVASSGDRTLTAYAFADGHEQWSMPYPTSVDGVEQIGDRLYGQRPDGSDVALG